MSDTLLAIVHMCLFPGGVFALLVAMFFKGLDRRVEARLQRRVGPPGSASPLRPPAAR